MSQDVRFKSLEDCRIYLHNWLVDLKRRHVLHGNETENQDPSVKYSVPSAVTNRLDCYSPGLLWYYAEVPCDGYNQFVGAFTSEMVPNPVDFQSCMDLYSKLDQGQFQSAYRHERGIFCYDRYYTYDFVTSVPCPEGISKLRYYPSHFNDMSPPAKPVSAYWSTPSPRFMIPTTPEARTETTTEPSVAKIIEYISSNALYGVAPIKPKSAAEDGEYDD